MGRSSSKLVETPNNPIQELQYKETKREHRKRQQEKEQKQIAKLQKKHAKKQKTKKKSSSASLANKNSIEKRKTDDDSDSQDKEGSFNSHIKMDEYNGQVERKLKQNLNADLSVFLMNQIALGFQFFDNYDNDIVNISEHLLAKESEINQNLEEHSILLANPLDAACSKWLCHKPLHGPDKGKTQFLQVPSMYVVFENIDISRPNDANYDSISPLCKVDMDTDFYKTTPCREEYTDMLREIKWKGYVRLKLREDPKILSQLRQNSEEIYTDGSSGYSTTSGYSRPEIKRRNSNDLLGSESEYDYAYIAKLNTHHPMAELKLGRVEDQLRIHTNVLPESCVSSLAAFVESSVDEESDEETDSDEDDEYDYDEDDGDDDPYTRSKDYETIQALRIIKMEMERRRRLLQQTYLNSREFMRYFGDLLRHKLGPAMQMNGGELDAATYRGCSIYTDQHEIIPAIHVAQNAQSWPVCAFQFRIRERPISTNPRTGQQFQWPSRAMIKRIETFGFHVVPIGFAPKRQRNPFRELEWRIVFPKAERYLDQHLTQTQVKVFLMAKALVKTFVEPQEKNKALLFVMDHLHTHLYWECEQNYSAWPEEFLGDVLVRFIGTFMQRLREKSLKDFFIEERNLFESIPEYSLVTLYSILANILENPLMHLMVAFRNIEYADNLLPKLNFRRIYDNLVENDMLKLKMLAKNARNTITLDMAEEEPLLMIDEGARGLVGMKQHRERTNGKLRRKTHLMKHHIEEKKKQDLQQQRVSVESIDIEFFFSRNLNNCPEKSLNHGVENLRRTNLLELLLDHFIAMAAKAIERRILHLAKLYLAQAKRLCKLYHNYGCDLGASQYLCAIQTHSEEMDNLRIDNVCPLSPPALPIRTSVEPIISYQANDFSEKSNEAKKCVPSQSVEDVQHDSNVYVEMPQMNVTVQRHVSDCVDRLDRVRVSPVSSPFPAEPRKSIKFIEKVTEVHDGDTNPIQKPIGYSPVGILRFGGVHWQDDEESDVDEVDNPPHQENDKAEDTVVPELSTPPPPQSSLMNKFGSVAGILKSTPVIGETKVMKSLTSSTEKMITSISTEEKRVEIRDMLRRKTIQLKGVFNQSSDT